MSRVFPLLVMAGLVSLTGCLTTGSIPDPDQQLKPGLLVGPEAIGKAAPPVELPAKESAKVCLRTAQELEMKGQTEEAIGLFEKARASDPGTAKVASRRLAVLYDKAGDFTKSTAEYEALLKANPKDADLLNDLGYSYYCRGDWTNAEAYLAKAVQQNPNHKRAWVNLGLARAQQAKWDESFQAFCQAVRPADAHCNIAFALAAQGKTEEAKAQYRQALTLDPGMQIARGALARLENPKAFDDAYATKNATKDPEAAAAQIPTIAELEDRLVKEGKLKARQQTTEKTPSIPAPTP